jgi:hypothetical protein
LIYIKLLNKYFRSAYDERRQEGGVSKEGFAGLVGMLMTKGTTALFGGIITSK